MDLEAQVRDYKLLLAGAPTNFKLGLTKSETEILQALVARSPNCLTVEMLYNQLYGGRLNPPEVDSIKVFMFKTRQKLKRVNIYIETVWGRGYRLTTPNLLLLEAQKEAKDHA
jgi:DNA-binding response OmpR family regulator